MLYVFSFDQFYQKSCATSLIVILNDKIHLSNSGKIRLAEMLKSTLKEVVYRSKLENEFEVRVK